MVSRPKINLTLSPLDKALEIAGKLMLIILWALTIFAYLKLPETIPIHFNAEGKADNYGNKATLLFAPILGTLMFWGLTVLNKYPHIFNYMTIITESNAEIQYTFATRTIRFLKLAIVIIMTLVTLVFYLAALRKISKLENLLLPVIFGLLIIPAAYYILRSLKAK